MKSLTINKILDKKEASMTMALFYLAAIGVISLIILNFWNNNNRRPKF